MNWHIIVEIVPDEELTAGCQYCEMGWATGPGLVYPCGNCNSEINSQLIYYDDRIEN